MLFSHEQVMNKIIILALLLSGITHCGFSQARIKSTQIDLTSSRLYTDSCPWTRWWWFASVIEKPAIINNLKWLKDSGFGGVEIAWVYPVNRMKKDTIHYTPRQDWLSPAWTEVVAFAKQSADSLGLGCDFTFGSLWPVGDSKVPFKRERIMGGLITRRALKIFLVIYFVDNL